MQQQSMSLNPEAAAAAQEAQPAALALAKFASVPKNAQNVSAIKGTKQKKQLRVAANYATTGQQQEASAANLAQQRRMTLLDQPLVDGGKYDVLTVSAIDQAKMQEKQRSVLIQGQLPDFKFDSLM